LPAALRDLATGRLSRATFLERFGHRGPQEMELAQPRWAEEFDFAPASGGRQPPGQPVQRRDALGRNQGANAPRSPEVERLRAFLGLRETAKHHFMRGYALIRRLLVE